MKDLFQLNSKSALVTGGSRGIGEMIATGFVMNGVKTYISSRKAGACDATAARLSEYGKCISIPCDLSSLDGVQYLATAMAEREEKLDILVNNAGATWGAPMESFPESAWDKIMAINLKAPFFLTQALVALLEKAASHEDLHIPVLRTRFTTLPCRSERLTVVSTENCTTVRSLSAGSVGVSR